jgi:hypothetical protein
MKYIVWILLLFGLSISAFGQEDDSEVLPILPDDLMRQVVVRITNYYFRPSLRPKTIYFSRNAKFSNSSLKQDWLPTIRNITFELVDADTSQIERKGYVFEVVEHEKKKNTYTIEFGYGDLVCGEGSGRTWTMRVTRSGIRLWPDGGHWGWECASDSATGPTPPQSPNRTAFL